MLKIALAQINPTVGGLSENRQKISQAILNAKQKKANFIVFPELALCGYPPEDLLLKKHFIRQNISFLEKIVPETKGIVVLIGFVHKKKAKCYNSCALIQDRKIIDIHSKIELPNYGIFDERRYFWPGETLGIYELAQKRFALTICEDIWKKEPLQSLKDKKLDFIVNISASPFSLKKLAQRKKILSNAAKKTKSFVFYCNLVGGQDEVVYDGRSLIYSPEGKPLKQAKSFAEDIIYFDLARPCRKTIKVEAKKSKDIYAALCLGLKDYMGKNGFQKAILGLSGGLDSAVTLALAVESIGKNKIEALIMPSRYTSRESLIDAQKICKNLKVRYQTVDIDCLFETFRQKLKPFLKNKKPGTTEENLQARIRGNILMAFSNKFGYLVITTGNKSEISCGYCTLYGDLAGGFALIKDVYKTSLYGLARFINKKNRKKIIPDSIIKKAPSAELKFNQKDTDSLPEYSKLDKILHLYIEEDIAPNQIIKKGFNQKTVKRVVKMVDQSEYKRRQAPLGIKISERAFGKDRRMPITNAFDLFSVTG